MSTGGWTRKAQAWAEGLTQACEDLKILKPKKCRPTRKRKTPGWDKECDAAVARKREKKEAFRRARKEGASEEEIRVAMREWRVAGAECDEAIQTATSAAWKAFCATLTPNTPTKTLYKAVKNILKGKTRRATGGAIFVSPLCDKSDPEAQAAIAEADKAEILGKH